MAATALDPLLTQVDRLCSESERVLAELQAAAAAPADEGAIQRLRSSVELMVQSYSDAWPQLLPSWSALQAQQSALARQLQQHAGALQQQLEQCSYTMEHPKHGAKQALAAVYEAEEQTATRRQHAQRAQEALGRVQRLHHSLHTLRTDLSSFDIDVGSESVHRWCGAYHTVESELAQLAALDAPAMSQALFFVRLQQQAQQLKEDMIRKMMETLTQAVRMSGQPGKDTTGVNTQEEHKGDLDRASSTRNLELSVQPSASLPLSVLFSALHELGASAAAIETLGSSLLIVMDCLLQHVSQHGGIDLPLHFATTRHAGGRTLRVHLSGHDAAADVSEDSSAPLMEGSVLEVVPMMCDFIGAHVFAYDASSALVEETNPSSDAPSMPSLCAWLSPRLQPLLLRHLCHASVPRNVDELLAFPSRGSPRLVDFERRCIQRGIMHAEEGASGASSDDTSQKLSGPISAFLANLTSTFQQQVRERVLLRTQQLVIGNTFDAYSWSRAGDEQTHKNTPATLASVFYTHSTPLPPAPSIAAAASPSSSSPAQAAFALLLQHSRQLFARGGAFTVSQTAVAFTRMLYELQAEASRARDTIGEECFFSLFSCIRSCVLLYTATSGVHRSSELEAAMQLGLLMHNDAAFVAQHLVALHAHVCMEEMQRVAAQAGANEATAGTAVPSLSHPQLMLVDLSSPLQSLGNQFLLLHVRRLRSLVSDLADSLASQFGSLETDHVWHTALQETKRALHQMAAAEKAWQQTMGGSNVLRASVLTQPSASTPAALSSSSSAVSPSNGWPLLLGLLLEQLASRIVGSILDKADISVEAASRIYQLITIITNQYAHVETAHTPSWPCLLTIREILHPEQSLAGLTGALSTGRLNSLTPTELSSLVRALYYDGEPRTRFLRLLADVTGVTDSGASASVLDPSRVGTHIAAVSGNALSLASSAFTSIRQHGATQRITGLAKQAIRDTRTRLQQHR